MSNFAIVATFEIAPGQMDKFLRLIAAHRDRCLKDEPSTLRFDILRPQKEENKVMLYEVYQDEAAFQLHWNGPHVARVREETAIMVAKVTGIRCSVLAH
jgi:quinol monooxygenase YgiN